jgi:outer membrane receptor for ferrienterochelin and colicin
MLRFKRDKAMNKLMIFILFACTYLPLNAQTKTVSTVREQMELVQKLHHVNFVYDSSLNLDIVYQGRSILKLNLEASLQELFGTTDIKWELRNKYVLLKKRSKFTISGYVLQKNGEPLINATIRDVESKIGTLSNEYGFFSLTLLEGKHTLRITYIGFGEKVESVDLNRNIPLKVYLKEDYSLDEVLVVGDLNSPINTTQTGKVSFNAHDLRTEYALFSSPDVVKTLQSLPGVASGTEMLSGLYVHGGNNDENLFLLDGTPLYQVSHLGGLFSAFNTDIIKNIDFYKSGFPARYGGRLSSVVDVRTNDGDLKEYHGTFSMGLLDGRIQYEGPIIKNRTSFNIAMRRSWLEAFSAPAFYFRNKSNSDDKITGKYAFHDINAKLTHYFSDISKVYISFYTGNDMLKINNKQIFNDYTEDSDEELYRTNFNLQWGNATTAIHWNYRLSPKLFVNITGVYSRSRSSFDYKKEEQFLNEGEVMRLTSVERYNRSIIDDAGYRLEFDYRPGASQHIRMGSNYLFHAFHPQSRILNEYSGNEMQVDTLRNSSYHFYRGHEFTLFAEDDIALGREWRLNIGIHYTMFKVTDKTYHDVEPRAAIRYLLNEHTALKLSYTEMSQFMHLLSSTYLNFPTDYWVPSTSNIHPMRSRQFAAGLYMRLPYQVNLSVEGFYKTMNHILEYDGKNQLAPSVENWEADVKRGKGRAYGVELALSRHVLKTSMNFSYTLSWSKRKFDDIYRGWYANKFDNRHKINISVRHQLTQQIEAYAAWNYHSGNKITVPSQYIESPALPGINGKKPGQWVYEEPNNATLPAYHRLDLGVNFRKVTKRGFERIWNISIYNAYCRMNVLYAKVDDLSAGKFTSKATGVFPIIPSFSYTLKF